MQKLKRVGLFIFSFILFSIQLASATETHLEKKHSIGLKWIHHPLPDQKFFDDYSIDAPTLTGGEVEYEYKLNPTTGFSFALAMDSESKGNIDLKSYYILSTLKIYAPYKTFIPYFGAGFGFFRSKATLTGVQVYDLLNDAIETVTMRDSKNGVGAHALVGIEIYIYKNPAKYGEYDWPVSLYIENKYAKFLIRDFDENLGVYPVRHLDIGGNILTVGIKVHW